MKRGRPSSRNGATGSNNLGSSGSNEVRELREQVTALTAVVRQQGQQLAALQELLRQQAAATIAQLNPNPPLPPSLLAADNLPTPSPRTAVVTNPPATIDLNETDTVAEDAVAGITISVLAFVLKLYLTFLLFFVSLHLHMEKV